MTSMLILPNSKLHNQPTMVLCCRCHCFGRSDEMAHFQYFDGYEEYQCEGCYEESKKLSDELSKRVAKRIEEEWEKEETAQNFDFSDL